MSTQGAKGYKGEKGNKGEPGEWVRAASTSIAMEIDMMASTCISMYLSMSLLASLPSCHCLSSWIILVNLSLSVLRVIMGRLVHRETEDKQEPRSDLASTTHKHTHKSLCCRVKHVGPITCMTLGMTQLLFLLFQGNKGVRGVVGVPGYIVSID